MNDFKSWQSNVDVQLMAHYGFCISLFLSGNIPLFQCLGTGYLDLDISKIQKLLYLALLSLSCYLF